MTETEEPVEEEETDTPENNEEGGLDDNSDSEFELDPMNQSPSKVVPPAVFKQAIWVYLHHSIRFDCNV